MSDDKIIKLEPITVKEVLNLTENDQSNFMALIYGDPDQELYYTNMDKLPFGVLNCEKTRIINGFFKDMVELEEVPEFTGMNKVISISQLFMNCRKLDWIEYFFDTEKVIDFSEAFANTAIEETPVLNVANGIKFKNMFANCEDLKTIYLSNVPENFYSAEVFRKITGAPENCCIIVD